MIIRPLVFDLETSILDGVHGPDFRDPENDFYSIIYGGSPDNVTVEHSATGFERQLPPGMVGCLDQSDMLIGHNMTFDLSYVWHNDSLRQYLLGGGKIWDTQVAEYILTAQQHQYASLGELYTKYYNEPGKIDRISKLFAAGVGADEIIQRRGRCSRVFKTYEQYCALDGSNTLKVFKAQYIRAKKEGMFDIIMLYQDYLLSLINMSTTGIQLDIPATEQTLTDFNLKHIEYLQKAQEAVKKVWSNSRLPPFNINSNSHKSVLLFGGEVKNKVRTKIGKYKNGKDKYKNVEHKIWLDGFGVPTSITQTTKTLGVYKVDDAVMQKIESKTKNNLLKEYCHLQKEAGMYKKAAKTYLEAFLARSVKGVLYPNFNNTAVVTGRLSSSKPNLQNVAKRNKFGKLLHKLFVAPPGWKCVQIDFSQLEIWVSAFLSGDKQLIADLQSGIDMHCLRVSYIQDCVYEEAFKNCKELALPEWIEYRNAAKIFSYQRAYGCGLRKLIEFTGLSEEKLNKLIEKEEARYPKASNLWQQVRDSIENTKTFSYAKNKPSKNKTVYNTYKGFNLLQIFDKQDRVVYNKDKVEKIGYWTSPTGKKYHFTDTGNITQYGVRRTVSPTVMKNYPMQGTAADIQGVTTAALFKLLLKHRDKIKMINEVHDSKWFYIKEDYLDRLLIYIKNIIENVGGIFDDRFGLNVPFKFPVDVETGDNFAELETYKPERGLENE